MARDNKPGDPCPHPRQDGTICPGLVRVYASKVAGASRVRYLHCPVCLQAAGKQIVPLQYAPRTRRHGGPSHSP